jgi:beta-glucosidase-like glycosyl hydrolase
MHFNAIVDPRSMWDHYMPVFRDCVVRANAMHVMCSYNAINGVPTCGDGNLMNGILRKKWNWTGFVVSDYDAWVR